MEHDMEWAFRKFIHRIEAPLTIAEYQRKRYRKNPQKVLKCIRRWQDKNKEHEKRRRLDYWQKVRYEVIHHYSHGKLECAYCRCNTYEFLTLDHPLNNGYLEKKNGTRLSGTSVFLRLRRERFPRGYQILCYNCNMCKARYSKEKFKIILQRHLGLLTES